jgi:hypothetical protein
VIPNRNPAAMTADEHIQEIALILATGYARLALSRQKALAVSPRAEALCDHPVNGDGADPARRSA